MNISIKISKIKNKALKVKEVQKIINIKKIIKLFKSNKAIGK